jgi:hypothetical protein
MPPADAVNGRVGCLDVEIALHVPDDALWPHVVRPAQTQYLFHKPYRSFVRMVVDGAPPAHKPLVAEFMTASPAKPGGLPIGLDLKLHGTTPTSVSTEPSET